MQNQAMKTDPQRLKQLREQRGWSQEQLAEIAGLSTRTVQRVEARGAASLETRMALAVALGVQAAEWVDAPAPKRDPSGIDGGTIAPRHGVRDALLVMLIFVIALMLVQRMGASSGAANKARSASDVELAG